MITQTKFDYFVSKIINALRAEATQHRDALLNGEVENYDQYRLLVGTLGGLQFVEDTILQEAKRIGTGEDEDE